MRRIANDEVADALRPKPDPVEMIGCVHAPPRQLLGKHVIRDRFAREPQPQQHYQEQGDDPGDKQRKRTADAATPTHDHRFGRSNLADFAFPHVHPFLNPGHPSPFRERHERRLASGEFCRGGAVHGG